VSIASFDKDGVCITISDTPLRQRPGGVKAEVPPHTKPADVWWDGKQVQPSVPCSIDFPEVMNLGDPAFKLELPAGAIAMVNGYRQRTRLHITPTKVGVIFIDVRGSQTGSKIIEVRSHVEHRSAEYPSFGDQLDALWKGYAALRKGEVSPEAEAMLERLTEIKDSHPKGSDT
jgi:hypothetical protein